MYRHEPIHERLPLLGEYSFSSLEAPHRLVTFLNKTLKRRGIIFGLTQTASHEFRLSVYDLILKEAGVRSTGPGALPASGPGSHAGKGRSGLVYFDQAGPDEADGDGPDADGPMDPDEPADAGESEGDDAGGDTNG